MPDEKVIPTPDEIRATFEAVRHKIACMNLCLDATIDDYPIGRRERGTRLDRLRRKMGPILPISTSALTTFQQASPDRS